MPESQFDTSALRGKIKETCGTIHIFASKMGISRNAMSDKINGRTHWTREDIAKACKILHIDNWEELGRVFYSPKSC